MTEVNNLYYGMRFKKNAPHCSECGAIFFPCEEIFTWERGKTCKLLCADCFDSQINELNSLIDEIQHKPCEIVYPDLGEIFKGFVKIVKNRVDSHGFELSVSVKELAGDTIGDYYIDNNMLFDPFDENDLCNKIKDEAASVLNMSALDDTTAP